MYHRSGQEHSMTLCYLQANRRGFCSSDHHFIDRTSLTGWCDTNGFIRKFCIEITRVDIWVQFGFERWFDLNDWEDEVIHDFAFPSFIIRSLYRLRRLVSSKPLNRFSESSEDNREWFSRMLRTNLLFFVSTERNIRKERMSFNFTDIFDTGANTRINRKWTNAESISPKRMALPFGGFFLQKAFD